MTKKIALILFLNLSLGLSIISYAQTDTLKVMAWNILHGANDIPNGRYEAIKIIRALDPDIILMVETYGSGKEMADSLGLHFHLIAAEGTALDDKTVNLSIFSKFPFGKRLDTEFPFYLGGREILVNDQPLRLFSNWFHYTPWHDEPESMGKSVEELLEWEKTERRWEMFQKVQPYWQEVAAQSDSIAVIIGGDMNTPSHLDWMEQTKDQHQGLIVPWQTTKAIEQMGFTDTYRSLHPDPTQYPGITWDVKGKKDEHRIDYIFYKGQALTAITSESYKAHLGENILLNDKNIPYPSDHGIVLTTFIFR